MAIPYGLEKGAALGFVPPRDTAAAAAGELLLVAAAAARITRFLLLLSVVLGVLLLLLSLSGFLETTRKRVAPDWIPTVSLLNMISVGEDASLEDEPLLRGAPARVLPFQPLLEFPAGGSSEFGAEFDATAQANVELHGCVEEGFKESTVIREGERTTIGVIRSVLAALFVLMRSVLFTWFLSWRCSRVSG